MLEYLVYSNIPKEEYNSWLLIIFIIIEIICCLSVIVALGLSIDRLGWNEITSFPENIAK